MLQGAAGRIGRRKPLCERYPAERTPPLRALPGDACLSTERLASACVPACKAPKVPLLREQILVPLSLALHPLWLCRATEGVLGRGDQGANSEG